MENKDNNVIKNKTSYFKWGLTAFTVIMCVIIFSLIIVNFSDVLIKLKKLVSILMPVIDGFVIAYLLSPIINKIEKLIFKNHEKNSKNQKRVRIICIIFVLILFILMVYELFALVLPEITSNIISIKDNSSEYQENFNSLLDDFNKKYPAIGVSAGQLWGKYSETVLAWFNSNLMPKVSDMLLSVTNGIVGIIKALWNFVIGIIISVYFMFNKEKYSGQAKKIVYALFDKDFANVLIYNTRFTNKTFNGFIVGKVIDSAIIGLLCYVLTKIIGTPYPLLVSIIVGVTNVIPFFGPFIGAVPSSILILFVEPKQCIYFIIMIFVLQQFDGNVLGPKILGDSTGLEGFWVIFAITFFGGIFGVLGMFIGVPLFAVLYSGFKAFIIAKLEKKGLKTATDQYINVNYIDDDNEYIKIPRNELINITSKERIVKNPFAKFKKKISNGTNNRNINNFDKFISANKTDNESLDNTDDKSLDNTDDKSLDNND